MFRFSLSNAFRRKGVAIIAILGTALGIALMTVLLSLSEGMDKLLTNTMNMVAGDVVVNPQDAPLASLFGGGSSLPGSYISDIEGMPNVTAVSPLVNAFIPKEVLDVGDPLGATLSGVDLARDAQMKGASVHITEGRSIQGPSDVIVGRTLLQQARMRGLKTVDLGSQFALPRRLSKDTIQLTIVGIFETGNLLTDSTLYTTMDTARDIAGLSKDAINSLRVRTEGSEYVEGVAQAIDARYKESAVPVRTMIPKDILGDINRSMDIIDGSLLAISLVAAVAGGVSIFIIMLMSVMARMREFGIVKAAGWSNLNILSSVVIEAIVLGLSGAAVGFGIGIGVASVIDRYLGQDIITITATLIIEIVLFGIIMGIIGGLYPAVSAARVSPIETMRAL